MKARKALSTIAAVLILYFALSAQASAAVTHTVKAGDWLSKIAKTYGVTVEQIKQYNALKSDTIYVGQKLVISPDTKYVVKKGDTLSSIAARHSTTVAKIKSRNKPEERYHLSGSGAVTSLPRPRVPSLPVHRPGRPPGRHLQPVPSREGLAVRHYTVKAGDTLTSIARNSERLFRRSCSTTTWIRASG
jgi:LysM repeat protein